MMRARISRAFSGYKKDTSHLADPCPHLLLVVPSLLPFSLLLQFPGPAALAVRPAQVVAVAIRACQHQVGQGFLALEGVSARARLRVLPAVGFELDL